MRGPREGRIALVTYGRLPQLADDDRLLLSPLARRGLDAEPVAWDAPDVRWEAYDAVVIRSCWDYHLRLGSFLDWIATVEGRGAALWNPPAVLRWNADKRYLLDLQDGGVPTVPTRWIDPGTDAPLGGILEEAGWDEVVVKPTVSASAHETWRTSRSRADGDEERFRALAAHRPLMLQPFIREVTTEGEWSLVFVGGRFSHAVLKRPRSGDFRVQLEHGGSFAPAEPGEGVVGAARAALGCVPGEWLYARVDGCLVDGRLRIVEVEMLEPSLFLAADPAAPDRFAEALLAALAADGVG